MWVCSHRALVRDFSQRAWGWVSGLLAKSLVVGLLKKSFSVGFVTKHLGEGLLAKSWGLGLGIARKEPRRGIARKEPWSDIAYKELVIEIWDCFSNVKLTSQTSGARLRVGSALLGSG